MAKKINHLFRKISIIFLFSSSLSYAQTESDIVITEIFYNAPGNDTIEFIELYNNGSIPINLNGYAFTKGVNFVFPNISLAANDYIVVTNDSLFLVNYFTVPSVAYEWDTSSLQNTGESIVLRDNGNIIADSVRYNDQLPWDTLADGYGYSIILCNPDTNNNVGYHWVASGNATGTNLNTVPIFASPGFGEGGCSAPGEVFPPRIKDVFLPNASTIYIVFDEPVDNSAENLANYTGISISNAVRTALYDTVVLTLSSMLSTGIYSSLTISSISDTSGNIMSQPVIKNIVYNDTKTNLAITEIMYNNPGNDTLEFIEIQNLEAISVEIGGYRFGKGVDFQFPTMTLAPNEFVVVAKNAAFVNSFFGISNTLQWKNGGLQNNGEKITLKNTVGDFIDSLTYSDVAPWPTEADGFGSSLILCDPNLENSTPSNWTFSTSFVGNLLGNSIFASPDFVNCNPEGINENIGIIAFQAYPNPIKDRLSIKFDYPGHFYIQLYDALGKLMFTTTTSQKLNYIPITTSSAFYILRITDVNNLRMSNTKLISY